MYVRPGASNVIPGEVRLTCEVRHASEETCVQALAEIRARSEAICDERGTTLGWHPARGYLSTQMDDRLHRLLSESIEAEGIRAVSLLSGAGHDAVNISQIAPVSMLFVRCEGGISHNPAESVDVADVEAAIRVMTRFLERLASSSS
jgi:allantoate deiminase